MQQPLVSVIIPSYNQAEYLADAVNSVLKQSFRNWEAVIINDGSSDETESIAKQFCQSDERIKYIYQDNQGICSSRNTAIAHSTGKYILCLDGDDRISDKFIEEMVAVLDSDDNVKVVTSAVQLFGKRNKRMRLPKYSLEALMGKNLFVVTSMFRKKDFDKSGGFKENMKLGLEDWDFWLSLLEDGGKVVHLENITFFYRIKGRSRNKNISSETDDLLRRNIYENHKALFSSRFFNPKYSFEYEKVVNSMEYRIGKLLLKPIRYIYKSI